MTRTTPQTPKRTPPTSLQLEEWGYGYKRGYEDEYGNIDIFIGLTRNPRTTPHTHKRTPPTRPTSLRLDKSAYEYRGEYGDAYGKI